MTKSLSSSFTQQKNTLDSTGAWIRLYQVQVNGTLTLYLTDHSRAVNYGGSRYNPYPIKHDRVTEDARGSQQTLVVRISNVTREPQYYAELNNGLRGRKVTMILIYRADDGKIVAGPSQTWLIRRVATDEQVATIELGKPIPLLEVKLPTRIITRDQFPSLVE